MKERVCVQSSGNGWWVVVAVALAVFSAVSARAGGNGFNSPGHVLIADQFNNRVVEVDTGGNIVWSFGLGPTNFTPRSIIGCNDAQRVGEFTLMAGTGIPPGVVPTAPDGAVDNRVILVSPGREIVWQYGQFGVAGSGTNQLNVPVQCTWLPNSHVLITDQSNERVIEVTLRHRIVWQYGTTGMAGNGPNQLNNPNSAELLANGHILIADQNNNRAIEVTRDHQIVATFTASNTVNIVAFASRLPNGDTLLTDSGNARVVEVDANDNNVWEYDLDTALPSVPSPLPTRAVRLKNGDTLISNQFDNQVIRVNMAKQIVATYGLPLTGGTLAGTGGAIADNVGFDRHTVQNGMFSPYDAKVIGDYTGLTPPFGFGGNDNCQGDEDQP